MEEAKQVLDESEINLGEAEAEVTSWTTEVKDGEIHLEIELLLRLKVKKWWEKD
ncbi:MAG: hypothetical protein QXG39_08240 [Candidatus Aenigmatarchaeota archaeon]